MKRRDFLKVGAGALIGAPMLLSRSASAQHLNDYQLLQALSSYLNNLTTMEGTFTQAAPDGRVAQGMFYLRRPGRLRFEYEPPYTTLVIADGFWAAVLEKRRGASPDRIPLSQTPLYLLLKDNVDFTREGAIRRVDRGQGVYRVLAVDPDRPHEGSVTMIFSANPIELRQWVVTDAQGQSSSIRMQSVIRGGYIDPAKFVIPDRYDGL